MRDNVENFIAQGGNVAFFSGNTCWWQVTFDDPTTIRRSQNWYQTGRPENSLTGVSYRNAGEGDENRPSVGYIVQHADHWIFRGTGLAEGQRFGLAEQLVGYECDGAAFDQSQAPPYVPTSQDGTPQDFVILGVGDVSSFAEKQGNAAATMGVYTKNGTVFTAATTDWPRVVARNGEPSTVQITRNVLSFLSENRNVVFVATDTEGRIFYNRSVFGKGGQGWRELEGGGRTDAAPAAALVGTYLFVVVKGLDGNIYLNQGELGQPFVGWETSGDFKTDVAPGACSAGDNIVFVANDTEGRIFYNWSVFGQGGQGWRELEGGGRTDAAPAAALVGTYLFVVVKGLDGNIYLNQGELGQPFVGWETSGDFKTDVAPGACSAGDNIVFVANDTEGRIFYNWSVFGQGGQGWRELEGGGRTDAAPAAALVGTYLFVVVKGLDGNIYLNQGELGQPFVGWETSGDFKTDVTPGACSA